MNKKNVLVERLELAIKGNKDKATLHQIHSGLLSQLRDKGPVPEWDRFPLARDFFIQRYA